MRNLASIQTVNAVEPIPNADAIERIRVLGWWVIVKKGEYKAALSARGPWRRWHGLCRSGFERRDRAGESGCRYATSPKHRSLLGSMLHRRAARDDRVEKINAIVGADLFLVLSQHGFQQIGIREQQIQILGLWQAALARSQRFRPEMLGMILDV